MYHLLFARECGIDPPELLPRVLQHKRYTQIELTSTKEFSRGHKSGVVSIDIDRETGRYVISGGRDKRGHVLIHDISPTADTDTGEVGNSGFPIVAKTTMSSSTSSTSSHAVSVVQWYPHDTGLFTTSAADHILRIWDTNRMEVVEKFPFSKMLYSHSMALSESHSLIAVGGAECKVTLCDMVSGSTSHILRSHTKPVLALAWSPLSEHLLATAGKDCTIVLWDVRKAGGPLMALDQHNGSGSSNTATEVTAHNGSVNGLRFTSDGLYLVSFGCDNALRLWNSHTGRNTLMNYGSISNSLTQQTVQMYCTDHSCSTQPLAVLPSEGELIMVELMTGRKLKGLRGHYNNINCVIGHPLEQELYSGGNDRNILAWEAPLPSSKESTTRKRGQATPHSRMGVYYDTWSDDED